MVPIDATAVEVDLFREPGGQLHLAGCRSLQHLDVTGEGTPAPVRHRLLVECPDWTDRCRCVELAVTRLQTLPRPWFDERWSYVASAVPRSVTAGTAPWWLTLALLRATSGADRLPAGGTLVGLLPSRWLHTCKRWHGSERSAPWRPRAIAPVRRGDQAAEIARTVTAVFADELGQRDRHTELVHSARLLTAGS